MEHEKPEMEYSMTKSRRIDDGKYDELRAKSIEFIDACKNLKIGLAMMILETCDLDGGYIDEHWSDMMKMLNYTGKSLTSNYDKIQLISGSDVLMKYVRSRYVSTVFIERVVHYACKNYWSYLLCELIKECINKKICIGQYVDEQIMTAFDWAYQNCFWLELTYLYELGCRSSLNPSKTTMMVLMGLLYTNSPVATEFIVNADPTFVNLHGDTVLSTACKFGNQDVALAMIKTGRCNIGHLDIGYFEGYTPLIWACCRQMSEVALALIATGESNPHAITRSKYTAELIAKRKGMELVVAAIQAIPK